MSEKKPKKETKRISVPLPFDNAMKRLMQVKPPADGDYSKISTRRARKKK